MIFETIVPFIFHHIVRTAEIVDRPLPCQRHAIKQNEMHNTQMNTKVIPNNYLESRIRQPMGVNTFNIC